jgi:outer membrane cobalamin receptor
VNGYYLAYGFNIDNQFSKDHELAYPYDTPRRGAFLTLGLQQS